MNSLDSFVLRQLSVPYLDRKNCESKLAKFAPNVLLDETKCCAGNQVTGTLDNCEVESSFILHGCRSNFHSTI